MSAAGAIFFEYWFRRILKRFSHCISPTLALFGLKVCFEDTLYYVHHFAIIFTPHTAETSFPLRLIDINCRNTRDYFSPPWIRHWPIVCSPRSLKCTETFVGYHFLDQTRRLKRDFNGKRKILSTQPPIVTIGIEQEIFRVSDKTMAPAFGRVDNFKTFRGILIWLARILVKHFLGKWKHLPV